MIKVSGTANVKIQYEVELDMTEDQWDNLSERKQNEMLDSAIDWIDACSSGESDDFEVDDVRSI